MRTVRIALNTLFVMITMFQLFLHFLVPSYAG